jgi:hypothetical protein
MPGMIKKGEIACLGCISSFFAMIVLSLSSCGIDTINYLSEDPIKISETTSSFIFSIQKTGSESYLGVELFYRIYASDMDADTDKNYITARQSETNSVPGELIKSQLISAGGLRYISPAVNNSIKIPIIGTGEVDNDNDYINVSFPTSGQPNFYIDSDSSTLHILKRNVIDESDGEYKSFLDDKPVEGDPDYRSSIDDLDETIYYVQFYSAAYGLDKNTFEDLYGNAIYLGRVTLIYEE